MLQMIQYGLFYKDGVVGLKLLDHHYVLLNVY